MRTVLAISMLVLAPLALITCDDDTETRANPGGGGFGGGGAGGTEICDAELIYDPLAGNLDIFPDDLFTRDEATPTGLMVHTIPGESIVLSATGEQFSQVFVDLSTLDGFGTTAALVLQTNAPLDPDSLPTPVASTEAEATVLVVALPQDGDPELLPFEWQLVPESPGDPRTTLIVSPLAPLAPQTRHGLVMTKGARTESGGCVAPSPTMAELLTGEATDPLLLRLADRYTELADALGQLGVPSEISNLSAATVFTTQHTVEDSAAIATAIRDTPVSYSAVDNCTDPGGDFLVCEGELTVSDFRVDGHHVDDSDLNPQGSYTLSVTTYLPKTGSPPYRTIIFGHGLNGDRHQAEGLADFAAPQGYATIAIDAVKHGDHPDQATSGLPGATVLEFFGVSLGSNPMDGLALRDNFRQSTYDKLQLVEMLRPGIDVNGDTTVDMAVDNLIYLGVSLGGIMAPEFLAFVPEVQIAIPIVPGARVVDIIKSSDQFALVIDLMAGQATDGEIARFFPVLQTIVDRGDAGAYLGHVAAHRLAGFDSQRPQVLMQMVLDDDTVPNPTNLFFARGLGVPHVGEQLLPIGLIPHEPSLPVSGNLDAEHTGGVFQYDIVFDGAGPDTKTATHSNVARNTVTQEQILHFFSTYYASGVAEILDPYVTLGIKP